jgi:hypothetical protein
MGYTGKNVLGFLGSHNSPLANIMKKVKRLQRIEKLVHTYLGDTLKNHCKLANFTEYTLTLLCNSSNWSTRLHYASEELIQNLRKHAGLEKLEAIRVKIDISIDPPRLELDKNTIEFSKENAEQLKSIADSVQDAALKKVLLRIVDHSK